MWEELVPFLCLALATVNFYIVYSYNQHFWFCNCLFIQGLDTYKIAYQSSSPAPFV